MYKLRKFTFISINKGYLNNFKLLIRGDFLVNIIQLHKKTYIINDNIIMCCDKYIKVYNGVCNIQGRKHFSSVIRPSFYPKNGCITVIKLRKNKFKMIIGIIDKLLFKHVIYKNKLYQYGEELKMVTDINVAPYGYTIIY